MYAFNITLLIKILNLACVLRNQRLIEHPIMTTINSQPQTEIESMQHQNIQRTNNEILY